jgi:acyl-CoA synthetase (AMP-forming)/AMP-acid ligase II
LRNWLIHELLADAAWQYPDVEVVSGHRRFTYAEEWERVVRLARSLASMGVRKGTVVGILDVNSHRYFELQHALSLVGAIVHTLNFRLPLADLVYTVQHAKDEILFVWGGFRKLGEALRPHVKTVVWMPDSSADEWITGERLIEARNTDKRMADERRADGRSADGRIVERMEHAQGVNELIYEELIQSESSSAGTPDIRMTDTDAYSILYTTGTTGRPKGMVYRHRDLIQAPLQIAHHLALYDTGARIQAGDTIMPLIPFFHIHGWGTPFFAPYLGCKLVLPERADALEQVRLIRDEGVTWSNMVPTQLHMLLDAISKEGSDVSLPLRVLTGGSPLPSGLAQRAHSAGIQFSLIYGGSDQLGTSISAVLDPEMDEEDRLSTLATRTVPIPMVRVEVRDATGRPVPKDGKTIGELWVQSPWLPNGYWNDPEASRTTYIDGWFRSDDMAVWFEDGSLYVVDRQKDAVKSGGEWIATSVIEAVLSELEGVELAAVLAMPDERWGERPLAVLQCKRELTESQVREHLDEAVSSGRLARFWIPDRIVFVESMPMTSAGKIHKVGLRKTLGLSQPTLTQR